MSSNSLIYFLQTGGKFYLNKASLLWCLSTREYLGQQFTFLGPSVLQGAEQSIPSCLKPWEVFRWGAQPAAEISHAISLVYLTDVYYFLQTQDVQRAAHPSLWWMGRCRDVSNVQVPDVSFYFLGVWSWAVLYLLFLVCRRKISLHAAWALHSSSCFASC